MAQEESRTLRRGDVENDLLLWTTSWSSHPKTAKRRLLQSCDGTRKHGANFDPPTTSYPIPRLPWPATLAHNDHLGSSDLARYRLPTLPWNISVSGSSTSSLSRLCHAKVCSCPTVSISPSTVHPGACGLLTSEWQRAAAGGMAGHAAGLGRHWGIIKQCQTLPNATNTILEVSPGFRRQPPGSSIYKEQDGRQENNSLFLASTIAMDRHPRAVPGLGSLIMGEAYQFVTSSKAVKPEGSPARHLQRHLQEHEIR